MKFVYNNWPTVRTKARGSQWIKRPLQTQTQAEHSRLPAVIVSAASVFTHLLGTD